MARKKIALIGAGNIGGELANLCVAKQLGDVVLFDIPAKESFAKGKALDLEQSSAMNGGDVKVTGTAKWEDCAGADVLIVTAGIPRKPGQSRDDLVQINVGIVKSVCEKIREFAPQAIVIVVSNPLDAMVYTAWKVTGFPTQRIMGQAGALDVARYKTFLAMELGISVEDISGLLLGGHGDDMVPLPRLTSVNGIPIADLLPAEKIKACVERAKAGGGEIVKLMGTSAYYAPASGSIDMVEAIVRDKKRLIPSAAYCEDEFGVAPGQKGKGYFVGVPAVIGSRGVEKIVTFHMTPEEQASMAESVSHVKDLVGSVRKLFPELG